MLSTRSLILMLAPAVVLAGCAATTNGMEPYAARALDTGIIQPGGEGTLVFAAEGVHGLHCDPHPFMEHDVTVAAGAASTEHVHILDGASSDAFRFELRAIRVAPGAVVTYHNHGSVPHTASEMTSGMSH